MKKRFKHLSLVFTLTLVCLTLLTGCFSLGSKWLDTNEIDGYGLINMDGEQISVCVTHDLKAIYLYIDNEDHELFEKVLIPKDDIYDTDWLLGAIDFSDINGDNKSDLQVNLNHADMSNSHLVWIWEEGSGFVYQPQDSDLYRKGVIYDPPVDTVNDFSIYEGLWQSDEVNLYPDAYLQLDAEGNFRLTSNGETIDEGYLKYDANEDEIYTYSKRGGAIDGGIISMEGDQLNISTCGYFNYLDGRGGQWQGDSGGNWDGENR